MYFPVSDQIPPTPDQEAHAMCPEKIPHHSILAPATLLVVLCLRLWAPGGQGHYILRDYTVPGTSKCLKGMCHCWTCQGAFCLVEEKDLTAQNHNEVGKYENRVVYVAKEKEGSNFLEKVHEGQDPWSQTRNVNNFQKNSGMKERL